jgi:hypothetical protein
MASRPFASASVAVTDGDGRLQTVLGFLAA